MFPLICLAVIILLIVILSKNWNDHDSAEKIAVQNEPVPMPGTPEYKGLIGEQDVKRILSRLPQKEYIVLNDVLLPIHNGTTQLDHVVVSLYGIFVLETKNYSGSLYGGVNGDKWTQYIGSKKFVFHNPLLQNEGHVNALSQYTHIGRSAFIPLVVFTGPAVVKVSVGEKAIYVNQLIDTIGQYRKPILTYEQIQRYARIIDEALVEDSNTKAAHLSFVKGKMSQRNIEIASGNCPQCDGYLVLRHGRYGDFWGCSNYPKCKYTMNISNNGMN